MACVFFNKVAVLHKWELVTPMKQYFNPFLRNFVAKLYSIIIGLILIFSQFSLHNEFLREGKIHV